MQSDRCPTRPTLGNFHPAKPSFHCTEGLAIPPPVLLCTSHMQVGTSVCIPLPRAMPGEFRCDGFLSHCAKDKPVVRDVAERLKKDGLRVWEMPKAEVRRMKAEVSTHPSNFILWPSAPACSCSACRHMRPAWTGACRTERQLTKLKRIIQS